jgi:hypothetical protein
VSWPLGRHFHGTQEKGTWALCHRDPLLKQLLFHCYSDPLTFSFLSPALPVGHVSSFPSKGEMGEILISLFFLTLFPASL